MIWKMVHFRQEMFHFRQGKWSILDGKWSISRGVLIISRGEWTIFCHHFMLINARGLFMYAKTI